MRRPVATPLWAVPAALLSCGPPALPELADGPPTLAVELQWTTVLETADARAHLPTSLVATDAGLHVLDGYRHRVWVLDAATSGQPTATVAFTTEATAASPVAMAAAEGGGFWLAEPGKHGDAGLVRLVDSAGQTTRIFAPHLAEEGEHASLVQPVALLATEGGLLIGTREGALLRVDPETGLALARVPDTSTAGEGDRSEIIADIVALPDGRVVATDPLAPRVRTYTADLEPDQDFGRYGLWAGSFAKPRGVAVADGGQLLVTDAATGTVQLFQPDGRFLGILETTEGILRLDQPLDIVRLPDADATYAVLEAGSGEVTAFRLSADAVAAAVAAPSPRFLRELLVPAEATDAATDGSLCVHCHDGAVNDHRGVWDEALVQHPHHKPVDRALPAVFPLSEDGQLTCASCHSPHGAVDVSIARDATADEVPLLARHAPDGGFTRVARDDAQLCQACHGDLAHEDIVARLEVPGGAHPSGPALARALEERDPNDDVRAEDVRDDCLGCHAPHAGYGQGLTLDASDARLCEGCHASRARAGQNHPVGRRPGKDVPSARITAKLATALDGGNSCRSCHDLVGGRGDALLRQPGDGGLLCLACHSERTDLGRGGHRRVRGTDGVPCLACHDVHGGDTDHTLLRTLGSASKGDALGCLSCHGEGQAAATAGVVPGTLGHPVDGSEIEGKNSGGRPGQTLDCQTCHDPHEATIPEVSECGSCHEAAEQARVRGGHGEATCVDCHPVHADTPLAATTDQTANPAALGCLACHGGGGEATTVADYTHPTPAFLPDGTRWKPLGDLPLFDASGAALPADQNGELICQSCHEWHGPDATKPGDKLRRPSWQRACAACHGESALPLYRYFHQPDRWPEFHTPAGEDDR